MISKKYVNDLCFIIVGCAIEVHKELGPGLLESVYHQCMVEELEDKGLEVLSKVRVPIAYKGRDLGQVLELDLMVNQLVIVEIKAVETIHPVFKAQLLSYLKLTQKPKGLLINFHSENITKSLVPMVTEDFEKLKDTSFAG